MEFVRVWTEIGICVEFGCIGSYVGSTVVDSVVALNIVLRADGVIFISCVDLSRVSSGIGCQLEYFNGVYRIRCTITDGHVGA